MGNPTSPRRRRRLARGLAKLVDDARAPRPALSSAVPLARGDVLEERELLLGLASDLAGDVELNPHGVALVELLLIDGASPIYLGGRDGSLHARLVHARAALHMG